MAAACVGCGSVGQSCVRLRLDLDFRGNPAHGRPSFEVSAKGIILMGTDYTWEVLLPGRRWVEG
jgi:hypothetical protein